jgi:hypothetical protein
MSLHVAHFAAKKSSKPKIANKLRELYGMTETGGATTNRPGRVKLGSVGRSWPNYDLLSEGAQTTVSPEGENVMRATTTNRRRPRARGGDQTRAGGSHARVRIAPRAGLTAHWRRAPGFFTSTRYSQVGRQQRRMTAIVRHFQAKDSSSPFELEKEPAGQSTELAAQSLKSTCRNRCSNSPASLGLPILGLSRRVVHSL